MVSALLAVTSSTYPLLSPTAGSTIPGSTGFGNGRGTGSSTFTQVTSAGTDIFGSLIAIIAAVAVASLLGVFVIIVVANRADPDPTGRRPRAVYHFFVSFVTVLTAVGGSLLAVWSLLMLVGTHDTPLGDDIARALVLGGLVTLVSLVLLTTHRRRGLELARAGADSTDPSRRVAQSYVAAISFIFVLVLLVTTVLSAYLVFALIGPGVFGSFGGRSDAFRDLLDAVYLLVLSALVLATHRHLLPPGLWSTPSAGPGDGGMVTPPKQLPSL